MSWCCVGKCVATIINHLVAILDGHQNYHINDDLCYFVVVSNKKKVTKLWCSQWFLLNLTAIVTVTIFLMVIFIQFNGNCSGNKFSRWQFFIQFCSDFYGKNNLAVVICQLQWQYGRFLIFFSGGFLKIVTIFLNWFFAIIFESPQNANIIIIFLVHL